MLKRCATSSVSARTSVEDGSPVADGATAAGAGAVGVRARASAGREDLRTDEAGAYSLC